MSLLMARARRNHVDPSAVGQRLLMKGSEADWTWPNRFGEAPYWAESTPLAAASSHTTAYEQGFTTDGTYRYLIGTSSLAKYDASWALIASNGSALSGASAGLNHIGDGQVSGGYLYCPGEYFSSCASTNSQCILVYSASDLSFVSEHALPAGPESSGLGIYGGYFWICSYCDGSKIRRYNTSDYSAYDVIQLSHKVPNAQGVYVDSTGIYVSSDAYTKAVFIFSLSGILQKIVRLGGITTEVEGLDVSSGLVVLDGRTSVRTYAALPTTHGFSVASGLMKLNKTGFFVTNFVPGDEGTMIAYAKPNTFFNYSALVDNAANKDYFEAYTYSDGRIGWRTNYTSTAIITKSDPTAMMRVTMRWKKSGSNFITTLRIDGVNNAVTVATIVPAEMFIGGGTTGNNPGDWQIQWFAAWDIQQSDAFVDAYSPA